MIHVNRLSSLMRLIIKIFIMKIIYPAIYGLGCLSGRIKHGTFWFVNCTTEGISENYKLLYDRLDSLNGLKLMNAYMHSNKASSIKGILHSCKFLWGISRVEFIILEDTVESLNCIKIRTGTKVFQLWHACGAYKKFGYALHDKKYGYNQQELKLFTLHKNYTYVTVSSKEVVWAYQKAMNINKSDVVLPIGISRTDIYFDQQFLAASREKLVQAFPCAKDKKVILYAPTFRGNAANAHPPEIFALELLKSKFGRDYIIILKHHPFIKNKTVVAEEYRDFVIVVKDEISINELIAASNICITDYSSIVFEYSLLEKPIIFYVYDLDDYIEQRGFFYDYEEFLPGPIARDTTELAEAIKQIEYTDMRRIKAFKEKFMSGCDGHATERLIELINLNIGDKDEKIH